MDLDEIWQEHKRFIVTVVAGMALYFIGGTVLDSVYGADIRDATSAVSRSKRALAQGMYDRADQRDAEEQNAALLERFAALERAVAFAPRDGFTIPTDAPDVAQNTYLSAVERVSADLEDLASRTRAVLPDGLGLDMLETRNVGAIERHLHALDLLERATAMALDAGVRRVRDVRVELDPAFRAGRGLGAVERTTVQMEVEGSPESVARWLARVETPVEGDAALGGLRRQALPVKSLEVRRASSKRSDAICNVTFLVVRLHDDETEEDA